MITPAPALHREGDPAQRVNLDIAHRVSLMNVIQLNDRTSFRLLHEGGSIDRQHARLSYDCC